MTAAVVRWLEHLTGGRVPGELLLLALVVGAACATPAVQTVRSGSQFFPSPDSSFGAKYAADYTIDPDEGLGVMIAIKLSEATIATLSLDRGPLAPLRAEIIAASQYDLKVIQQSLAQARARVVLADALERAVGQALALGPPRDGPLASSPFSGPLGLPVPDIAMTAVALLPGRSAPGGSTGAGSQALVVAEGTPTPASAAATGTPPAAATPTTSPLLGLGPSDGPAPPRGPDGVEVPTLGIPPAIAGGGPSLIDVPTAVPGTPQVQATPTVTAGAGGGGTAVVLAGVPLPAPTAQGPPNPTEGGGGGTSGGGGSSPTAEPTLVTAISPFSTVGPLIELPGGGTPVVSGTPLPGGGLFRITTNRDGLPTIENGLLVPGQWSTGTIRLENPGQIPWAYSLVAQGGSGPLWSDSAVGLQVEVRRSSDNSIVHRGPIARATPPLGELQPGEFVDLKVGVLLPGDAPNPTQGQSIKFDFVWTAQSAS